MPLIMVYFGWSNVKCFCCCSSLSTFGSDISLIIVFFCFGNYANDSILECNYVNTVTWSVGDLLLWCFSASRRCVGHRYIKLQFKVLSHNVLGTITSCHRCTQDFRMEWVHRGESGTFQKRGLWGQNSPSWVQGTLGWGRS